MQPRVSVVQVQAPNSSVRALRSSLIRNRFKIASACLGCLRAICSVFLSIFNLSLLVIAALMGASVRGSNLGNSAHTASHSTYPTELGGRGRGVPPGCLRAPKLFSSCPTG